MAQFETRGKDPPEDCADEAHLTRIVFDQEYPDPIVAHEIGPDRYPGMLLSPGTSGMLQNRGSPVDSVSNVDCRSPTLYSGRHEAKMEKDGARALFRSIELASLPGVPCPCGTSHRAFADVGNGAFSLHLVEISKDSRTHYHRKLTEVYYFLEGVGQLEIDGALRAVRPGMAVLIPPGVRHRAVPGREPMKVLNFVMPAFDPADEWFDSDGP